MEVKTIKVPEKVHKKYLGAPLSFFHNLSYRYGTIDGYETVEVFYKPNILGGIFGVLVFPFHMLLESPYGTRRAIKIWKDTFVTGFKRHDFGYRIDKEGFEASIQFL